MSHCLARVCTEFIVEANFVRNETGKKAREDNKLIMPGDNVEMTIETNVPIAIESGLRFTVREGGKTVGTGVVSGVVA
jgi:elongation factor Tu